MPETAFKRVPKPFAVADSSKERYYGGQKI